MSNDDDIFGGSTPSASPEDLALASKMSNPQLKNVDELDFPADESRQHAQQKSSDSKKKTNPLIFVGIGVGVFIFLVVIALILRQGGQRQDNRAYLQSHQNENQLTIEISSLREQFSLLRNDLDKVKLDINAFRKDVDKKLANTDLSKFNDRLIQIENSLASNASAIKKVASDVANNRPLADHLVVDKSARLLSIGNGIARVRDEYGEEYSLHRGDRWDGKTVTAIRADLRKVFLSNGSVIE